MVLGLVILLLILGPVLAELLLPKGLVDTFKHPITKIKTTFNDLTATVQDKAKEFGRKLYGHDQEVEHEVHHLQPVESAGLDLRMPLPSPLRRNQTRRGSVWDGTIRYPFRRLCLPPGTPKR